MKATILGAALFQFLRGGDAFLAGAPEPLNLLVWGILLLSLSAGAKAWLLHRRALAVSYKPGLLRWNLGESGRRS